MNKFTKIEKMETDVAKSEVKSFGKDCFNTLENDSKNSIEFSINKNENNII